jgi:hypothetical protein
VEAAIKLAELGLTVDGVIRAAENVAELGPTMELLSSREEKLRKALEYCEDEGHPIPVEETGSVYDRRGMVFIDVDVEPHYVDGELVRRAPDPVPEVVDEPTPKLVRLPSVVDDEPVAEQPKTRRPPHRPPDAIPFETFWELFRLAVKEDASARVLAKLTDERADLAFVNRNKTGNIVKWVKSHPTRARQAVDRHELPREFRATPDGVVPPAL